MSYLKDREIWLSNVPTGNPPTGYFWKFIQNGRVVVRDSSGNNQIMVATSGSQAITGSLTVTGGITGTATTASYVEYSNVANKPALVSGSAQIAAFGYATTGSNGFNGSQSITGSLTVTGQVVAQTLNVQQVTSSIVYSSGSNIFGNSLANTQQFTGSMGVTGSLTVAGTTTANGISSIGREQAFTWQRTTGTASDVYSLNADSGAAYIYNNTTANVLMSWLEGGNVGIGTASPSQILDVQAARGAITTTSTTGTNTSYLQVNNTGGTLNIGIDSSTGGSLFGAGGYTAGMWHSGAYPLTFGTSNTERVRITSGGNVGIGTTSPGLRLHVSTTAAEVLRLQGTSGGSTNNTQLRFFGSNANTDLWAIGTEVSTGSTDRAFDFYDLVAGANRMRITSGGNVGIGTPSPTNVLSVVGGNGNQFLIDNTGQRYSQISIRNNGTQNAFLATDSTNTEFQVYAGTGYALALGAGGGERMRITSSGNVGIGTTSPSAKLHIDSPTSGASNEEMLRITRNTAGQGIRLMNYDGGSGIDGFTLKTLGSTNLLHFRMDGNIGIGTASPSARLNVSGIDNGTSIRLDHTSSYTMLYSYINGANPIAFDNVSGSLVVYAGGSERMRLTSGGNVGIGINNPSALLQVRGPNATGIFFDAQNEGAAGATFSRINVNSFPFNQYTFANGNVGIGVTSPSERLEVNGSLRLSDGNADGPQLKLASSGFSDWNIDNLNGNLRAYYGSTEYMRLTSGGRTLLIGSSSSGWEDSNRALLELNHTGSALLGLRINGNQRAYFYHNNSHLYIEQMLAGASIYVISVSGGVYLTAGGTSWTSNSDERLKNINGEIENAVDKLNQLRAVNFSWKNNTIEKQNLGLIAQDVEKVFPELIDKNKLPSKANETQQDETEYLGVRYQELIPVLVKAIQEQQTLIESLKSRIEILEQ